MSFNMKYTVTLRYLTAPSLRRSGVAMNDVVFIVAHDTGNENSTAAQNVRYYESSRNDLSASAHLFVDDREILECIPVLTGSPEKAWHVRYNVPYDNDRFGADANDSAVSVELCFSTDGSIDNEEAYKRYVWVLAYICYRFGLDPATSIAGHEELDPTRREDPSTALRLTGRTFEDLVRDVVLEYTKSSNFSAPSGGASSVTGTAFILANALHVRSEPSLSGSILKTVNQGEAYQVFYEQNGWYNVGGNEWISANANYVRFVPDGDIFHTTAPSSSLNDGIGTATILAYALNVRSQPSLNGTVIKTVSKGETYKVFYEQDGWYNVGGNEWISASSKYVRFRAK
ncbi:SH3 domain-containing protein [Ectobacillus panaciterrae]|uniref:SH3 domain-containing protein n=1 Tax=Ectobacillus panaciterrae TaxID=363872 RepID=UPI000424E4B7|nr:SH3 domain-containing protein [Ectobacillus panaciterrae]